MTINLAQRRQGAKENKADSDNRSQSPTSFYDLSEQATKGPASFAPLRLGARSFCHESDLRNRPLRPAGAGHHARLALDRRYRIRLRCEGWEIPIEPRALGLGGVEAGLDLDA